MATPRILNNNNNNITKNIRKPPKQVICFSFAAYAKSLISHLRSSDIPVSGGLSDVEFSSIESLLNFTFPPDLRAILREGLPVAAGFPNWRSSSPQQLHVLLNLPILCLLKQVSRLSFWCESWGPRPENINLALELAKKWLRKSPILVPIFRNCYIPCSPSESGNPVFHIDAESVRILSFDITGFFQDFELFNSRVLGVVPVWAAKSARRIEFWSEAAERRKFTATRGAWWSDELGGCLEEVFWRLREGGWEEEEVREMLMMMDGCDVLDRKRREKEVNNNLTAMIECDEGRDGVTWHVRTLSLVLLRAGWTTEDVVYSLDLQNDKKDVPGVVVLDGKLGWCSKLRDQQESSIKRVTHLQSLEV